MTGPNKRAKGEGSVYFRESDQRWVGSQDLPRRDPKVRRRAVVLVDPKGMTKPQARAATVAKLAAKVAELGENGDLPNEQQTTEQWLRVWFDTIAIKKIKPKTAATYRTLLENHILPVIGSVQLTKLKSAHVRRIEQGILDKGLSSTTAMQAHRIVAVALKYAVREERISKNVAQLTDAPKRARKEPTVLTAVDGIQVLSATRDDRLWSRTAAALLTGARQGELLGLELNRVTDVIDLSWQLQRLSWEHGCKPACGHLRGAECPKRTVTFPPDAEHRYLTGGLWLTRPKSSAGWRIIPLVDPLKTIIAARIVAAKSEPNPFGLLWTTEAGNPIDPRYDNNTWHKALARAGVPDVRLHDARHTTASLLLEAGVPEAIIMKILGHNTFAVTRGYQHVNRKQLDEAMAKLSALLPLSS